MMATLWALAIAYPAQAILLVVVLWLFVIVVVLALVSMARPELPLHQWADDDEQRRAVTRPASLTGNNMIPWGRRIHTQVDKQ
jgi:fatty acid desaturase